MTQRQLWLLRLYILRSRQHHLEALQRLYFPSLQKDQAEEESAFCEFVAHLFGELTARQWEALRLGQSLDHFVYNLSPADQSREGKVFTSTLLYWLQACDLHTSTQFRHGEIVIRRSLASDFVWVERVQDHDPVRKSAPYWMVSLGGGTALHQVPYSTDRYRETTDPFSNYFGYTSDNVIGIIEPAQEEEGSAFRRKTARDEL